MSRGYFVMWVKRARNTDIVQERTYSDKEERKVSLEDLKTMREGRTSGRISSFDEIQGW